MIKLIVFLVLFLTLITAFSLNLGFLQQGFSNIATFFESIPLYFTYVKDLINTLFNAPLISTILITGIAFVAIQYLLSLIGDEKK